MKEEFGETYYGDKKFTQENIHKELFPHTKAIEDGFCFSISIDWLITCLTKCGVGSQLSPISAWSEKCEDGYPFFLGIINEFRTYQGTFDKATDYNVIVQNFVRKKGRNIAAIGNGRIPNVSLACDCIATAVANNEANLIALRSKKGNHAVAMYAFGGVGYWYDSNFGVFMLRTPYNTFMQEYWKSYDVDDIQFSRIQ